MREQETFVSVLDDYFLSFLMDWHLSELFFKGMEGWGVEEFLLLSLASAPLTEKHHKQYLSNKACRNRCVMLLFSCALLCYISDA